MMNSMATHRYSPYSLPSHTTTPSTLQPSSYTSSSLLPSTQGISNSIQVLNIFSEVSSYNFKCLNGQSESQCIFSLAAFTGSLTAALGLDYSLAAQRPLPPLPSPEPPLPTHLHPLVHQSPENCLSINFLIFFSCFQDPVAFCRWCLVSVKNYV